MARTLSSDEVGVIADQTICSDDVKRPFYHWDDRGDEDSRYLIDFANAILKAYGSAPDPLSLVTAQREAAKKVADRFFGTMGLGREAWNAWILEAFPLPAPPAPEPVLSPEQVSGMVSRWNLDRQACRPHHAAGA